MRKNDFVNAMQRLFAGYKIRVVTYGRPSRQYAKIARQ
jgi:hypothetical protein